MEFITKKVPATKRIVLIAHDNMKADLIDWCNKNKEILSHHFLSGTGTTATLIAKMTGLPVYAYRSGPLGGDQQVGAKIAEGKIDMVIFFSDPLTSQPHDPDVKALLRIAQVYDVPMANNRSTAEYFIRSEYFNQEYSYEIKDYNAMNKNRKIDLEKNPS